jgi:hypothetical protein
MPSINLDFLNKLKNDYKDYPNFIETGTYFGETIMELEKYFSNLYTIEIKKLFYENVIQQYKGNKIKFFLGDSGEILPQILPKINGKTIIFLDGHWSGSNTGKGKKDCPLYEELISIMLHHKDEAIIIVDDTRLFGMGPNNKDKYDLCNWEDINTEKIIKIVKNRVTQHYFLPSNLNENDRLIIHVSKQKLK